MKISLITLLFFFSICSLAQQTADYTFEIASKYETDVELTVKVHYKDKAIYKNGDIMIKRINLIIRDSLKRFDVIEMYTTHRSKVHSTAKNIYIAKLKERDILITDVELLEVKIPEEVKLLNEELINLKKKMNSAE